jgi:hypothetical protein
MYQLFAFLSLLSSLILILGLIKPSIVRLPSRKAVLGVGFGCLIGFSVLTSIFEPEEHKVERMERQASVASEQSPEELKAEEANTPERQADEDTAERSVEAADESDPAAVRRDEERRRRTADPSYVEDLRAALSEHESLLAQAHLELQDAQYDEAIALSDSAGESTFLRWKVYHAPRGWLEGDWSEPYTWFHPEEERAWSALRSAGKLNTLARFRKLEDEYSQGLTTRAGTLERLVELAVAWTMNYGHEDGRTFRFGVDELNTPGTRFVKAIDITEGVANISLRAKGDIYKLGDLRSGEITFEHPTRTFDDSRKLFALLLVPKSSNGQLPTELREQFLNLQEINVSLYFPTSDGGENVIARYGLSRDSKGFPKFAKSWGKLKAKW